MGGLSALGRVGNAKPGALPQAGIGPRRWRFGMRHDKIQHRDEIQVCGILRRTSVRRRSAKGAFEHQPRASKRAVGAPELA